LEEEIQVEVEKVNHFIKYNKRNKTSPEPDLDNQNGEKFTEQTNVIDECQNLTLVGHWPTNIDSGKSQAISMFRRTLNG
jgi:hypothetical protein